MPVEAAASDCGALLQPEHVPKRVLPQQCADGGFSRNLKTEWYRPGTAGH